jgi:O-antigen ligase
MTAARARRARPARTAAAAPAQIAIPLRERVIVWSLALALLGSAWLVDPLASAAFDAPKRLAAIVAAAIGTVALLWRLPRPAWSRWSPAARWVVLLAVVAGLCCGVAALVSPHPVLAAQTLRTMALFALLLPLGASDALRGAGGRRVLLVALVAIASNALLSTLQAIGLAPLMQTAQIGGRLESFALLGNEGYVALASALLTAACAAIVMNTASRRARHAALALGVLGIATILANRQLTAGIALIAALGVLAAVRWRARRVVAAAALALVLAFTNAAIAPLRAITWEQLPGADVESLQRLTTYRLGAWAAAVEMASERPLTGHGPGTYAAQAQTRRLALEVRLRQRLAPPHTGTTFVQAHQEYLQLAAECGLPALFSLVAALALLLSRLLRLAQSPGAVESLLLLAVLVAGSIAALAWFPLQIPLVAVVLLLACGRAWRVVADAGEDHA